MLRSGKQIAEAFNCVGIHTGGASSHGMTTPWAAGRACSSKAGKNPGAFSEPVVTQAGTTFFKTVNFELYAKPTNRNKAMAYVGSAIFVGIMAYFTVMDYQDIQKAKEGAAAPPAAS